MGLEQGNNPGRTGGEVSRPKLPRDENELIKVKTHAPDGTVQYFEQGHLKGGLVLSEGDTGGSSPNPLTL